MRFANFCFYLLILELFIYKINSKTVGSNLKRQKRYLAFPEGATLSIALCMTAQTFLFPTEFFTEAINWGISYDLPNATSIIEDFRTPGGFVRKRRSRRDLYKKMELIMDSMGYNGKDCILKALCETATIFNQRKRSFLEEVLGIIFGFPTQEILSHEPNDHRSYRDAHIKGQQIFDIEKCSELYSKCTFSLVDMALGLYS